MGRTSSSETKLSGNSGDNFSWNQFWTYFNSELCTDDMRAWTLKNTNIVDCITGALPQIQIEILEAAPQVLINHPAVVAKLTPQAKKALVVMAEEVGEWTLADCGVEILRKKRERM